MVVAFSVIVQGSLVPSIARWLPRADARGRASSRGTSRFGCAKEPSDIRHFTVAPGGSRAADERIDDLPLSERAWIVLIVRDGEPERAGGSTTLRPGDEVLVVTGGHDADVIRRLFERGSPAQSS